MRRHNRQEGGNLCTFYQKVGVCRHGTSCVRRHEHPSKSCCILLKNIPFTDATREKVVEDVFVEAALQAEVQDMIVAANTEPHLKGCIYIRFGTPDDAAKVAENFDNRWFDGTPVFADLIPAHDLRQPMCMNERECTRGLKCNYVHQFKEDPIFWQQLYASQEKSRIQKQPQS